MANVNTMMSAGMNHRQAQAVVDHATLGVEGMMALGFSKGLAQVIIDSGTTEELMAMGLPAMAAVEVKAVIG
jgi:hypothetical protein